jgi:energy-coupling factor transport system ATP-binding protein
MTVQSDDTPDIHTSTVKPAVYVQNLSFRYRSPDDEPEAKRKPSAPATETLDQLPAIENISFSLPAGELMLIAGPSGCGKSTLLKCLTGVFQQ